MVLFISFPCLNIRIATRNEKERRISLVHGKLACVCRDDVFVGIPCRHLFALVCKDSDAGVKNLVFNSRWEKEYFVEKKNEEPNELEVDINDEEEKGEEEKKNNDFELESFKEKEELLEVKEVFIFGNLS